MEIWRRNFYPNLVLNNALSEIKLSASE